MCLEFVWARTVTFRTAGCILRAIPTTEGATWMARAAACLTFLWVLPRIGMALSAGIGKPRPWQTNVARTPTQVV